MGSDPANEPRPLAKDVLRLACASRALLEQRPDLRRINRQELAELTLLQIERDELSPEVLASFSPLCAYFRGQASLVTDLQAQQRLGAAEIAYDPHNALPAVLGGLSLSPACRALAAEQLLSLTDPNAEEFSRRTTGVEATMQTVREEPPACPIRRR